MIASELINDLVPPLKKSDTVRRALNWMEEFRLNQLAVVEGGKYIGVVTDSVLYDTQKEDALLRDVQLEYSNVFVTENQHLYDIIKTANVNNMQVLAVLDQERKFQGIISIKDTVTALARSCSTTMPGGIFVLSMGYRDYSLHEISRLIEAEGAKILSVYVEGDTIDPMLIKLTIKVNVQDLTRILATLERFNYRIIAKFQETPDIGNEKERLGLLFRFLDL